MRPGQIRWRQGQYRERYRCGRVVDTKGRDMGRDKRQKRDLHGLDANGMVLCNPRDREAAHRASNEGIATYDVGAVTCRKCIESLGRRDGPEDGG